MGRRTLENTEGIFALKAFDHMSTSTRVHEILFVGEVHASEVDGDDAAVKLVRRDFGPQTRCSGVRASATRRPAREGHLCTVYLLLDNRPAYTLQDTEADPIDPKGASARVAAVNRAALVGARCGSWNAGCVRGSGKEWLEGS